MSPIVITATETAINCLPIMGNNIDSEKFSMKVPPLTDEHGYLRRFPHHPSAKQGAWGIHAPSAKWSLAMGNRRG